MHNFNSGYLLHEDRFQHRLVQVLVFLDESIRIDQYRHFDCIVDRSSLNGKHFSFEKSFSPSICLPLQVSSKTPSHISVVTAVLRAIVGLQLISISQGLRSSPSIKSAPNNSNEFYSMKTSRANSSRTTVQYFSLINRILSNEHRTNNGIFHRRINELLPTISKMIGSKILLDKFTICPHIFH